MEGWLELLELVGDRSFIPLGLSVLLIVVVGSGLVRVRWRGTVWLVALVLLAASFYMGIQRHEWGEVLFNGQLL